MPLFGASQVEVSNVETKRETIGKVSPMGDFVGELKINTTNGDTSYSLIMRNHKYLHIIDMWSVSFSGGKKELEDLRKAFMQAFEKGTREIFDVKVKLGEETIWLSNSKKMGTYYLSIAKGAAYTEINEKQVNKLFGK